MTPQDPLVPASAEGARHEFTDDQNAIIRSAATWAMVLGVFNFISALGNLSGKSCGALIGNIVAGVLFVLISSAFKKIVISTGNDVGHLMEALQKLGVLLLIRIIATIIGVVVGIVLAVLIGGSVASSFQH